MKPMSAKALTVLAAVVAALAAGRPATLAQSQGGYGDYATWEDWARIRPADSPGIASSYDRTGANEDYCYYEDPPDQRRDQVPATVKTIQGPGIIYRFWMPHLTAKQSFVVRMFFDGETAPRIDTNSAPVLGGTFNYFAAPLVTTCAGGQVCYEPIPFAQSLRIETVNQELPPSGWSPKLHYYQYTYLTFPPGTPIESYTGALTPEQQSARAAAAALFTNAGQHPAGSSPAAIRLTTTATVIDPATSLTLADISGPGLVRQLNVRMDGASDAELEGLGLRVLYDNQPEPAIDASVAHFFGAGRQRALYRSIPLGTDSPDGFYSFWPMPFHRRLRIELVNTTLSPIALTSATVEYEGRPIAPDRGYLHARSQTTVRNGWLTRHVMVAATGVGHYVGNLLYVHQPAYLFYVLEGDDIITVDDTAVLYGTGLEDAYNGGYYYNWVAAQADEPEGTLPQSATRPLHGILYVHRDQQTPIARADQYRWRIADRVPFRRSIEVTVENRYALIGTEFTSVAFWYQLGPIPADFDRDSDVDQDDAAHFEGCSTGPDAGPPGPGCTDADLDRDADVDQDDFGLLQRCLSGADVLADPTCAD